MYVTVTLTNSRAHDDHFCTKLFIKTIALFTTIFPVILFFIPGCANLEQGAAHQAPPQLIGKTKDSIRACAGAPHSEYRAGNATVLRYYREAAMLDESKIASKGSFPGVHRGCWANLLIEDGAVTGIEFRPVPNSERETSNCETIFDACHQ